MFLPDGDLHVHWAHSRAEGARESATLTITDIIHCPGFYFNVTFRRLHSGQILALSIGLN
jgi:hypothetical protein